MNIHLAAKGMNMEFSCGHKRYQRMLPGIKIGGGSEEMQIPAPYENASGPQNQREGHYPSLD